jgi:hypothetical protein
MFGMIQLTAAHRVFSVGDEKCIAADIDRPSKAASMLL